MLICQRKVYSRWAGDWLFQMAFSKSDKMANEKLWKCALQWGFRPSPKGARAKHDNFICYPHDFDMLN